MGRLSAGWRLFTFSFVALFLELLLIRWAPSVVRLVAYYANLLLISSFLGLGWGALAGARGRKLFGWFSWLLAADIGFLLLCRSVALPGSGAEMRFYAGGGRLLGYGILVGIFAANTLLFVPLGGQIGRLFGQLPATRAYAWDLAGSLCGTVAFALFSFVHFDPLAGLALVALLALGLAEARRDRLVGLPAYAIALAAMAWASPPGAIWSPYYFITIRDLQHPDRVPTPPQDLLTRKDPPIYSVSVNQDFYQLHGTIDAARYTRGTPLALQVGALRDQYLLPYALSSGRGRVAVLGAGGGMDVEAALLSGARRVDAVDIEPRLIGLARRYNAAGVYDDPRVSVVNDDARAFIRRARPGYDLIVFGFLDSQALFSSMSNLRLDSFTYTVESLRAADLLLAPDGMLSLSFAAGQPWLARKIVAMVEEATGRAPIVYADMVQVVVCAPKNARAVPPPARFGRFARVLAGHPRPADPPLATDDWPFLYLSSRTIPGDYLVVIGAILVIALPALRSVRRGAWPLMDWHAFFLGLGFLLLETKSISDCSLYFGSTWLVTTIVVAGILIMVLLANSLARRARPSALWYAPLFGTLLAVALIPHQWVLGLDFGLRLLWALVVVPAPIFFAGILFSAGLRQVPEPGSFFGANLVGAMVGGFCEYLGMATGNSALMVLVFAAYLASASCRRLVAATPAA
ncbi:hypothetical protein TA3x_002064 [Tundrisphaera sp. TA3]|uniref:spermine/spermidine synthase domain-containing protein n=1 Tax=Tundrisphaera sp. TA3 TaxID=3435775 RepID=UPI003EBA20C7